MTSDRSHHSDTILAHAGRKPADFGGVVNTPVVRASTIIYPDLEAYRASRSVKFGSLRYGRYGTQTAMALVEAMTELEGGDGAVLHPSGLASIAMTLRSLLSPGDHLLVADSVYAPTRAFCDGQLALQGIEVSYYDPAIGASIDRQFRPNTRVVFAESPGSLTFDMQDIPALSSACRPREIALVVDGTWATPLFCRPLSLGADVVIHSATKYIVGHSDAMLGVAVARDPWRLMLEKFAALNGIIAGPDDCWLALRGLRSMGARLRQHQHCAMRLTSWLDGHPAVARILYPAHPGHPGHSIWRRDFTGASGLFGVELAPCSSDNVDRFIDALSLFGIGSSWGGYESLVLPSSPMRTIGGQTFAGPLVRLHAGLEHPDDLIADLEQALSLLDSTKQHGQESRHGK